MANDGLVGTSVKGFLVGTGFLGAVFDKITGKDDGMSFLERFGMRSSENVSAFLRGVGEDACKNMNVDSDAVDTLSVGREQVSVFLGNGAEQAQAQLPEGTKAIVTKDAVIMDNGVVIPLAGQADDLVRAADDYDEAEIAHQDLAV